MWICTEIFDEQIIVDINEELSDLEQEVYEITQQPTAKQPAGTFLKGSITLK